MRHKLAQPEMEVARIAARQHGVVSIDQVRAAGISASGVSRRVRSGQLHRIHRGVYAVGHPGLSAEGRWMAAVLACGEGAVLSHGSAAALWGLLAARQGPIEVSTPARSGRARRSGIRLHRNGSLSGEQVTRRSGIPVTTPARTIADLRAVLPAWQLRRAIRQAEIQKLRLGPGVRTDRTRSDLERDFLRLCRRHDLPAPEVNVRVGRWTVDFLWREARIAVETDGWGFHRGSVAFEDDHARDLDLRRQRLRRAPFHRATDPRESDRVIADLVHALSAV